MEENIGRLSRNIAACKKPVLETDIIDIKTKVEAWTTKKDSFLIKSANELPIRGFVVSTDRRLKIEKQNFFAGEVKIEYEIDTCTCKEGEIVKGAINVISNGGELTIPYEIEVEEKTLKTENGSLKNLFHFANLVQIDYEEALRIFKSNVFKSQFLENNIKLATIYEGLLTGINMDVAMEEFLIAANKKKPVSISISEKSVSHSNIHEDYGDKVVLSKNTWGYVDISISVKGDFISVDRYRLTSKEFAGNNYEFLYVIKKDKLRKGKNFGQIVFETEKEKLTLDILVEMEKSEEERSESYLKRQYKEAVVSVTNGYLDFRFKRIGYSDWQKEMEKTVNRIRGICDDNFFKLLSAWIMVSKGLLEDAESLIESVKKSLEEKNIKNIETCCFCRYMESILKRDDLFTEEVAKEVQEYFENEYDLPGVLFSLIYLDNSYNGNESLKLARVKGLYSKKKRSPILYCEALQSLNKVPQLLRVLEEFEIATLYYGMNQDYISTELALEISSLSYFVKHFDGKLFKIMVYAYEKYGEKYMLEAICSMLIKCNKAGKKYFSWYKEAIEKNLKITSLYEYYMYSIDEDYDGVIPQIVMMYFAYNTSSLPDEKIDLLYANIIKNKDCNMTIYNTYRPFMEKRVSYYILKSYINKNGKYVCEEILPKVMVGKELVKNLPSLLNKYEIVCEDEKIRDAIVIHKETGIQTKYPLKRGKAYADIFTSDVVILFEGMNGCKYYSTVDAKVEKIFEMEEYLDGCYEVAPNIPSLVLYYADKYLKYKKEPEKSIELLKKMLDMPDVLEGYKRYVETEIVNYYANNYEGENLDEYLRNIDVVGLPESSREQIIEMCVVRGLYERAYKLIRVFGFYNIMPGRLVRCISRLIESREYEKDDTLIEMAVYCFSKRKYNETILAYLCRFYNGTTKELIDMWEAINNYCYENKELEEKIICQSIYTGIYDRRIDDVYESYRVKNHTKKIKMAYCFSRAYDYFAKEQILSETFFAQIEKELTYDEEIVSDMAKMAYIRYVAKKDVPGTREIEMCKILIFELVKKGIVTSSYRKFEKYFSLPCEIEDKVYVEYRSDSLKNVNIYYRFYSEALTSEEYEVAEMKKLCEGVYVYGFSIFYGEVIQYYITEEDELENSINESCNITLLDVEFEKNMTHYGLLNDILVCRELNDERSFEKISKEYLVKKELVQTVFGIRRGNEE